MNEKNLGQKCSRCDGFMEQFRRGHNPICQKCQTIASRKASALRSLKLRGIVVDTSWSSWVCDCDEEYIYDKTVEICIMGCCKIQPRT